MINQNKRAPDSEVQATYPYNQATVTRSGHEIHVNDTPDNESLRLMHQKGTYVEIDKDGSWVQAVVGKTSQYFIDNVQMTFDGHWDQKILGALVVNINDSALMTIGTDYTWAIGRDYVQGIGGACEIHIDKDKSESIFGKSTQYCGGDRHDAVVGSSVSTVGGDRITTVEGVTSLSAGGDVEIISDGNRVRIKCDRFTIEANMIELVTPTGRIQLDTAALVQSSGTTTIAGSTVQLNP